jgi:putative peptidoglycan binding protein
VTSSNSVESTPVLICQLVAFTGASRRIRDTVQSRITEGNQNRRKSMKTKGLVFVSCLTAGALMASPAMAKPAKKSSASKSKRMAPQTTQVTRNYRHNQNIGPRTGSTRYDGGSHYSGARSYVGQQYSGTRYYGGTSYYGNNYYGSGTRYYYGGGGYPYSGYYSGWPYSNWGYGTSGGYYPYSYWGGYPYSGYNNYYSYHTPAYGYNASMVVAVQRRLGQLGYYHGVVDGVMGPQTRAAIAAFEGRNGLIVDGRISRPLIDTLGLG